MAHEPDARWVDDPVAYHPTTAPGARLPSVFLRDGSSLYEHLGPWFTVLVTGSGSAGGLLRAAREIGVPAVEVRLDDAELAPLYEAEVLLVRPDHHVAWRGRAPEREADATRIVRQALGWLDCGFRSFAGDGRVVNNDLIDKLREDGEY